MSVPRAGVGAGGLEKDPASKGDAAD